MSRIRLLYIVTHPITAANLMRGQLAYMKAGGMDVVLISSPGEELRLVKEREGIETVAISMAREIRPLKDCISLIKIYQAIRKLSPDIVNASTPKAGFLGMLAAWIAGVPVRIYTLRGLRLETKTGLIRFLLRWTERIASSCAHRIICVSQSLGRRYLELGLSHPDKITVIANGSSNGIDVDRFWSESRARDKKTQREKIRIHQDAPVIGYIGRLVKDKGIRELLDAFTILLSSFPNLHLLIIGDFEKGDPVEPDYIARLNHPQIIRTGFVDNPSSYYGLIDLLIFPSYREGFPNAPLEAAACGIPTVGFHVTGTVDAVEDGVTGRLVGLGNSEDLAKAILAYLNDATLRSAHGTAARDRAVAGFNQERIWKELQSEYTSLLDQRGLKSSETKPALKIG